MPSNGAERQALAASRVWDVMARGSKIEASELDVSFLTTIARLRELGSEPRPDAEFAQRLEAELLRAQTSEMLSALPVERGMPRATNGATAPEPLPPLAYSRAVAPVRRWLAPLATAALVLLALAGTLLATKGPVRILDRVGMPVIIQAIDTTPAPASIEDTLLFHQRVDAIPDSASWAGVERITLPVGGRLTQGDRMTSATGALLYRVESGRVSVQAEGQITLTRAGATSATEIPPGTTIELHVDDVVFTPSGVISHWRNSGADEAVLLDAGISAPDREPPLGAGDSYKQLIAAHLAAIPPAPLALEVHQLTLGPGATVSNEPAPGLKLVGIESGTMTGVRATRAAPTVPIHTDRYLAGSWTNINAEDYILRELRNDATEPLTLLVMTVVPVEADVSTSGTPTMDRIPGSTEDTILVQGTFADVPAQAESARMERITFEPSAEWTLGRLEDNGEGPALYRIESGALAVNAESPFEMKRAGQDQPLRVPVGNEVVLAVGDTVSFESGVISHWRNNSDSPASVMDAVITGVNPGTPPQDVALNLLAEDWPMTPPHSPIRLTLRRTLLAVNAAIDVGAVPGLHVAYVESGELSVVDKTEAGSSVNPLSNGMSGIEPRVLRADDVLQAFPAGRVLQNSASDAATVLLLTIEGSQLSQNGTFVGNQTNADDSPKSGSHELLMHGTFDTFPKLARWEGIARAVLAPGAEFALGKPEDDGEGPMLYRVEFGELTVNADGPINVTRAGTDTPITIPAGTDVVLEEGDQGFTPTGVTSRWRNARQVPTVVLDASIIAGGNGFLPDGVTHEPVVWNYTSAPKAPIAVAVHRLTLQPSEALAPGEVPGLHLLYVESGEVDVIPADQLGLATTIFASDSRDKPGQAVGTGSAYPGVFPADGAIRVTGSEPATLLIMTSSDPSSVKEAPTR